MDDDSKNGRYCDNDDCQNDVEKHERVLPFHPIRQTRPRGLAVNSPCRNRRRRRPSGELGTEQLDDPRQMLTLTTACRNRRRYR